jgi:arylsulfatase A-like enzyme
MNNIDAMRRYAAEVSGVDDGVGQVMEALEELGLHEDTLVIFTADQGLCGGHNGMWGMGDHSRPLHTYDGTMHIPLIYRWPGRIKAGKRSDIMVSNYDLMRTVLNLLGRSAQMPPSPPSPGRDYSPVLRGKSIQWENEIYYEFENTRCVRTLDWKYTWRYPDGPNQLFDLKNDPGEEHNLDEDPAYARRRAELRDRLTRFFKRYAEPKYDLWNEGGSKSLLLTFDKSRILPSPGQQKENQ